VLSHLWNIPDGFATLLAGSFVIIGAVVAWMSVQQQIRSAETIEKERLANEISALKVGFSWEIIVYTHAIIQSASACNLRAFQSPRQQAVTDWPVITDPLYYQANIGKIGLLRPEWLLGALIGFYTNLRELNDQSREAMASRPTVRATNETIAARLRLMSANLSQALDGLTNDVKIPIPADIHLDQFYMPDGRLISQAENVPQNLQDVLLRLAGR
jgi:hypothetical protein